MLGDVYNKVSVAQAITAATVVAPVVSTDAIDRLAAQDFGSGSEVFMAFRCTTTVVPAQWGADLTPANATEYLGLTAHGFKNGTPVILDGTTAPTGITFGTVYYATYVDANNFRLATTKTLALTGAPDVTFTTDGTAVKVYPLFTLELQVIGSPDVGFAETTYPISVLGTSGPIPIQPPRRFATTHATEIFTVVGHKFATGTAVYLSGAGTMPTGVTAGLTYYVVSQTADTFKLATTRDLALAGTADVTISADASGVTYVNVRDYAVTTSGRMHFVPFRPQVDNFLPGSPLQGIGVRYIGARYVVNSAVSAGAFDAQLALTPAVDPKLYPSGFAV